jgi:hypothetical protein
VVGAFSDSCIFGLVCGGGFICIIVKRKERKGASW